MQCLGDWGFGMFPAVEWVFSKEQLCAENDPCVLQMTLIFLMPSVRGAKFIK